jgi:hypothetical protein
MKKQLLIYILVFFVCGNVFSQTKNFVWNDIATKSVNYVEYFNNRTLFRHLKKHENRFKRKWSKNNIVLGKHTIKTVLNNLELYYVPKYDVEYIDSTEIWLKPAKNVISDIIFVYGNHYIGDYYYGRCKTMTHKHIRNTYRHALNYGVPSCHYLISNIDKDFLLDFFEKGFHVFSISGFTEGDNNDSAFWFSTDGYERPIKFQKSEVWKNIMVFNNKSIYKSKFYEHGND